jgi:hypothetical protein
MLVFVIAVVILADELDPDIICNVCCNTVTRFGTFDKSSEPPALVRLLAACDPFDSPEEKHECEVIVNANYSGITRKLQQGSSPMDICVNLSKCEPPLDIWSQFKRGFKTRWNRNLPEALHFKIDNIGIVESASKKFREHVDVDEAKENAKKVVKSTVETGKKAIGAGKELVKKVAGSNEWKDLKKNIKAAFSSFFARLFNAKEGDEDQSENKDL